MKKCNSKGMAHCATLIHGSVYAGGASEVRGLPGLGLEIDLTDGKNASGQIVTCTGGAGRIVPSARMYTRPLIQIAWPDMGVLDIHEDVFKDVRAFVHKGGKAGIYCMAGHGRTGTFLARLVGPAHGTETVSWLRENYCEKAVESNVQIEYLKKLGLATEKDKPSQSSGGTVYTKPMPELNAKEWEIFVSADGKGRKRCVDSGPCNYHWSGGSRSQHCGGDTPAKTSTGLTGYDFN